MKFGSGAFGRSSHNNKGLMNGVSALIKKAKTTFLLLPPCEDTVRRQLPVNQKTGLHMTESVSALVLDSLASGTVRNKFPLFIRHWVDRALRKEKSSWDLAAIRTSATPYNEPQGVQDGMWKNTGYWSRIADMHMKGIISVSLGSGIFACIEKC